MRKLQLWSALKEITSTIDGWDNEMFKRAFQKDEITFRKFLPKSGEWKSLTRYDITIKITEKELDEEKEMKKKSVLTKARSQLKKAEHVKTPLSIKRKLKKKQEKKS